MSAKDPIRVFVGSSANNEDLEALLVLEHSMNKHASRPVQFNFMCLSKHSQRITFADIKNEQGWRTDRWATPFSGFRWAVPHMCGFKGRAIYVDYDFIFKHDISALWEQEFRSGKIVMANRERSPRYCILLWNCAAAQAVLPSIEEMRNNPRSHADISSHINHSGLIQQFEGDWNCLDGVGYETVQDPLVLAVHYTAMHTQPHLERARARLGAEGRHHWYDGETMPHWRADVTQLFNETYNEAIAAGYRLDRYRTPEFGEYNKRSFTKYKARIPTRAQTQ